MKHEGVRHQMNRKDIALLRKLGACESAREWCRTLPDLETAWHTSKRSDWMLWALDAIGFEADKALRLYACACVRGTPLGDGRTVWDLLTDPRNRAVVEVAERYAEGLATDDELAATRDAAESTAEASQYITVTDATNSTTLAALSAAKAAAAVARSARDATKDAVWAAWAARAATKDTLVSAQAWQADRLREYIAWTDVKKAIEVYRSVKAGGI